MNTKAIAALSLAIALSWLVSCDDTSTNPVVPLPARLLVGDSVAGALPAKNADTSSMRYDFHVDSGRTYTITWAEPSSSLALVVWSSAGSPQFAELSSRIDSSKKSLVFPATQTGLYSVKVTGRPGAQYVVGLKDSAGLPAWVIPPDGWEYDNVRPAASKILPGGSWQIRTFATGSNPDVDWIRFATDSGQTYQVEIVDSSGVHSSLELYTADSARIDGNQILSTKKSTVYGVIRSGTTRGGFYRLRVTDSSGYPIRKQPTDDYESDNSFLTAKPITFDGSVQSRTIHIGKNFNPDLDLISFQADSGKTYSFHLRVADSTNYYLRARVLGTDSLERLFTISQDKLSDFILSAPCLKSGRYFVEISSQSGVMAYTISAKATDGLPNWAVPQPGKYGQGIGSAFAIPVDSTPVYRKLLGYDTDWVKIPLEKGKIYSAKLQLVSGRSYYMFFANFDLFDSTGWQKLAGGEYKQAPGSQDGSVQFQAQYDGVCYLRVANSKPLFSEPFVYEIRVSKSTIPDDLLEPDNSLKTAVNLTGWGTVISRQVSAFDEDWMKIQGDSGRPILITLRQNPVNASVSALGDLFSRDSLAMNLTWQYISFGQTLTYTPRTSGPFFLHIKSSTGAVAAYSVQIDTVPPVVAIGSCGTSDNPCKMLLDGDATASRVVGSDSRWFKVPVKSGTTYRFNIRGDLMLNFKLTDSTGYSLPISARKDASPSMTFYYKSTFDGPVLLCAGYPYYLVTSSDLYCQVSVVPVEAGDSANGTFAGAMPLVANGAGASGILTNSDRDVLRMDVDSGKVYYLEGTASDSLFTSIYTSDSILLAKLSGNASNSVKYRFSPGRSGSIYVALSGLAASQEVSWHMIAKSQVPDAYPINTSLSNAIMLPPDGSKQEHKLLGDDLDWIAVPVDSGVIYDVGIESAGWFVSALYSDDSLLLSAAGNPVNVAPSMAASVGSIKMGHKGTVYVRVAESVGTDIDPVTYKIWVRKSTR